ncbi:MAG: rhamnulokinase family protein [Phycisphaerales bacterium]
MPIKRTEHGVPPTHSPPGRAHVAIDLGAESGRVVVGQIRRAGLKNGPDDLTLSLHEVHRFEHKPLALRTGLHWDLCGIWREILDGLKKVAAWSEAGGTPIRSIGVDTWGVDFCFVSEGGAIIGLPRCYRDPRFQRGLERVAARIPPRRLFEWTGIQPLAFNTLFQLEIRREDDPHSELGARHLAMMPDLLHLLLGAEPVNEVTIASTSQLLDARTGEWHRELMSKQAISRNLFLPCAMPGTVVGRLHESVAAQTGLSRDVQVVLPASHDTASAVAAVPAAGGEHSPRWCYVSSGTWSLMGVELDEPVISDAAFEMGFTNELGVPREPARDVETGSGTRRALPRPTVRFHKNISGLWLVQECRRALEARGITISYDELTRAAAEAQPLRTVFDVNDRKLWVPGQVATRIASEARRTGQPEPATPGELVRACLDSLALEYRRTLGQIESLTRGGSNPRGDIEVVHIVGGGGKNRLLNQLTADATRRRVIVGPFEATAAGNLLVQAMGLGAADPTNDAGAIRDLEHLRAVVAASERLDTFEPTADPTVWAKASARYESVLPTG